MPLTPGTRIGPYEIAAPIGAGGMGEVYRARDAKLGRDVALKVLPPSLAGDLDRLARFRREAQVLAALNHPNIAHVHGFEDSGSVHALVMELVDGSTLADRIAAGPMALADALPIARQIAEAMEAAHEQGIVHRDLKPANIKVRDDGMVKVLDFGLAKALSADPSSVVSGEAMNSPTLTAAAFANPGTQMGVILGTAAYMSPEQAKGRPVDRRADIWAFGVILFEMLTGRRGYEADDISETLAAVLTREVDWSAWPPSAPALLKALVRDCLARDPKQRLRDIGEARRTLERLASGADVGAGAAAAQPPIVSPPSRLPWIVAAAAILIAAIASVLALRPRPETPARVVRLDTILKDFSALIGISPDGTKVSYTVAGGPNTTYLALRHLDQFEAKPIPGTEGGGWPVFSPDGQWIAFGDLASPTLRKIPVTGGSPSKIGEGSFQHGAAWSADDTIVFSGAKGLMTVPASGGTATPLTTVDESKNELAHRRPQFLPGGTHLLFSLYSKGRESAPQFAVLDLAARTYRVVAPGGVNGRYLGSGHLTYLRGGTLFAVPFDAGSRTVAGIEVPVVEGVSQLGPDGTGDYAVSDDGTLVYIGAGTGSEGTTLAWADRQGRTTVLPGQPTRQWGTGRLSPDGRMVANGITDAKGVRDVWILDVERGTTTRVTFGPGNSDYPVWTRDSRQIYFATQQDGKPAIARAPADGSARPSLVHLPAAAVNVDGVSPDGRWLIFTQPVDGSARLMLAELDAKGVAGEPRPLHDANAPEMHAQISPDGKWVAYTSLESGNAEVYLHAFPGGGARVRVSTDGGVRPRWSRDGRDLLYWAGNPNTRLMSVAIPADGAMRLATPALVFQTLVGTTWDVTPSKERFLIELSSRGEGTRLALVTNWFEELRRRAPVKR
jgi:serine/threonine-protein kinase